MAFATTHTHRSGLAERLSAFIAEHREAAAKRTAVRRTRDELAQLSDRELDDLGVSRYDIPRVAREAVYGV